MHFFLYFSQDPHFEKLSGLPVPEQFPIVLQPLNVVSLYLFCIHFLELEDYKGY